MVVCGPGSGSFPGPMRTPLVALRQSVCAEPFLQTSSRVVDAPTCRPGTGVPVRASRPIRTTLWGLRGQGCGDDGACVPPA